ncbi:MAG TPA: hypothetical protein VN670_07720, partial [Acidobacteriaceae bacterium]|nr:hypothetical protein [Acidobacteriaceae bacterium]
LRSEGQKRDPALDGRCGPVVWHAAIDRREREYEHSSRTGRLDCSRLNRRSQIESRTGDPDPSSFQGIHRLPQPLRPQSTGRLIRPFVFSVMAT